MKTLLLLITLLLALTTNSFAFSHMHKKHILDINGTERTYFEHNPFAKKNQTTIIILASDYEKNSILKKMQLDNLSYKHEVITIYPESLNKTWNDGTKNNPSSEIDDVEFIESVIDDLITRGISNPNNIYITGSSNGGNMAYRLGCEISEKISAIISVAASLPKNYKCSPNGKLGLLALNLDNDPTISSEDDKSSE